MHDIKTVPDRPMPEDVAEAFAAMLDLENPPDTLRDWLDVTVARLDEAGVGVGVDELCLTDDSRHHAEIDGETQHFACVLDTLLLPTLLDDTDQVTIESESPVSNKTVSVEAGPDDVVVEPRDAVMSFGASTEVTPPDDVEDGLLQGEAAFCPYINAFPDRAEYEEWSDGTPKAATIVLDFDEGLALAARIASVLGDNVTSDDTCGCG